MAWNPTPTSTQATKVSGHRPGRRGVTRDGDLADRLAWHRTAAGAAPGSLDWLAAAGRCGRLMSASLARTPRHSASQRRRAPRATATGPVPGLASHPDHAVAKSK